MRKRILCGIVTIVLLVCAACGSTKEGESDSGTEEITKDSDAEDIVAEANRRYGKEKKRGSTCVYTYVYSDGESQEETETMVFDVEAGILESTYRQGDSITGQSFSVKDGDQYYSYEYDADSDLWVRYEQEPDDNGKTTWQYHEEGDLLVFTKAYGYQNVEYSKIGEEEIDGTTTVRIRITAEEADSSGDVDNSVTRDDVLTDYGLTEEAVGYIDGLSDALDRYVEAINKTSYSLATYENDVWIDAETLLPVKYETHSTFAQDETVDESGEDPLADFVDNYWKAMVVSEDMESGMSLSEALEDVAQQEEAYAQTEESDEEEEIDEEAEVEELTETSMEAVETFVYGDDCAQTDALPTEYTEVTEEDYLYGEYLYEEY